MVKEMNNTLDMTKGKYWKVILIFALPIFLSNLFQQLYNAADSFIVGQFLDTHALAAVTSSGSLIFLFTSFFTGTALGAGVVISKYFGKKDYDSMRKAIHTDIAFGLVAGVILTVGGYFISPFILKWMDTDPEVLPLSISYFQTYFLGSLGVIMYNICTGICNAVGNSRRPLYYLIISSVLNILLDLLFIGVFHWGVWSAAFATVISQIVSAVLCFTFLLKKGNVFQVVLKEIKFDKESFKEIIHYGLPTGIQNSVIAFANVIVQSHINGFGSIAMAGCGTYFKIEGFAFLPINCFTMAITTFVSQNFGAGLNKRARQGARFGIITSVILAESLGALMFILAPYLIGMFDDNPDVIAVGVRQMRTEVFFFGLLAFSHCIAAVCRGSGRAVVPMLIMLIVWCGIRVLYLTIMSHFCTDIIYVFWAYPITWFISSVVYLIYYFTSGWEKGFKPIKNKENKEAVL